MSVLYEGAVDKLGKGRASSPADVVLWRVSRADIDPLRHGGALASAASKVELSPEGTISDDTFSADHRVWVQLIGDSIFVAGAEPTAALAHQLSGIKKLLQRDQMERLLIRPTSASRSSAAPQPAHEVRITVKRATIEFYGLGVDLSGDDPAQWTARTMASSDTVPFADCTLAHIWPASMAWHADELASELRLPDGFYTHPRNFLVLPKLLEVSFDKMGVLLIPKRNGDIVVRQWGSSRHSAQEEAAVSRYYSTVLEWPTRQTHIPHLPFMRLMAFRVMCASTRVQPARGVPSLVHEDLLDVSAHEPSHRALQDIAGRMGLVVRVS